jgi:hypothetical protein
MLHPYGIPPLGAGSLHPFGIPPLGAGTEAPSCKILKT